jgi:hypothetical protein
MNGRPTYVRRACMQASKGGVSLAVSPTTQASKPASTSFRRQGKGRNQCSHGLVCGAAYASLGHTYTSKSEPLLHTL